MQLPVLFNYTPDEFLNYVTNLFGFIKGVITHGEYFEEAEHHRQGFRFGIYYVYVVTQRPEVAVVGYEQQGSSGGQGFPVGKHFDYLSATVYQMIEKAIQNRQPT